MSARQRRHPRCDCGACCDEHGHDEGCTSLDPEPVPSLEERIANPTPGSFLDYLMGGTSGQTPTPPA